MKGIRVVIYLAIVILGTLFNFYFRPIRGNGLVTEDYRNSDAYINDLYVSDEYFKKHIVDKDFEETYRQILKSTMKDTAVVKIPCEGKERCLENFLNTLHSIYLDHPELISYVGVSGIHYENGNIIYENFEGLPKIQTIMGTKRIEREMENIRKDTEGMDEKEKILYVYNYVASHNYDKTFTSLGSNQSAYSFFGISGKSVCAGFAKASQMIFQNIGVNSYLVLNDSHLWNFVEYEGKWYIFDATYGTGFEDKNNPHYYDGLAKSTVDAVYGYYPELYPKVEETTLKELFGV